MGNTHTEQGLDFLLDNYKQVGEEASLKILEDKNTGQQFALKEDCFINRQEYDRYFKKITMKNNQTPCENILQMAKIWSKEHNGVCSNLFKIYTVYEYPKVKLIDQIEARLRERKHFEEVELFSILQSCLNAIQHEHKYVNLSPHTIFILPEGVLKLIHTDLLDPNHRTMYNEHYYYSPEKISFFQKQNETIYELQKQSVFSLGMTILHSAVLKSPAPCYEISMKRFNHRKLELLLNQLQELYSPSLLQLLSNMLNVQTSERYHYDQVQTAVTEYFNSSNSFAANISESVKMEESIKMATHLPEGKPQELSLIYSGETFHKANESDLALESNYKKKIQQEFRIQLSKKQDLPRNHSILQRTKKNKQPSNKENLYTDPKIIQLIRSGIQKISKSYEPSQELPLAPREFNQNSQQKTTNDLNKDPFSQYELTTENKDKCMFIVQTYEDKSHFEGMVQYGMKNGYGRLIYPDGVYYEGNFKNDTLQGKGALYYGHSRPAYVGDWINNKFHGKGTLYNEFPTPLETNFDYRDFNKLGDCWVKYEGQFTQDIKCGYGKIIMTSGQVMQGLFSKGLLNGECCFTTQNGSKIEGIWKNNILISN